MIDQSIAEPWRGRVVLTAELRDDAERRALYRRADRGDMVRVALGAYVARDDWDRSGEEQRHLLLCRAVALTNPGIVFSHRSAAIIHGLPVIGLPGARADVVAPRAAGGRSNGPIRRHCVGEPESVDRVSGLWTTTRAQTVVHLATLGDLPTAVAAADAYLRGGGDRDVLASLLADMSPGRWRARVARVLDFAKADSESPGESFSRVVIDQLGFPAPVLQHEVRDSRGFVGRVDFWWPGVGIVGEFDGMGKYLRDDVRGTRDVAEAVVAEKHREDRIRAAPEVRGFARWGWRELREPETLRERLLRAGLIPSVSSRPSRGRL